MGFTFLKIIVAACIISFSSWLAGKRPEIAGLIIALPLMTLLTLAFSYVEHKNISTSITLAKSIFVGIPVSLLFFVPFLLSERWNLSFWQCYGIGLALLVAGYFIHRTVLHWL